MTYGDALITVGSGENTSAVTMNERRSDLRSVQCRVSNLLS